MADTSSAGQSRWGKVADVSERDEELERDTAPQKKARALVKEVGAAVSTTLAPAADRAAQAVRTGARSVERALEDPTAAAASEILSQADLPEIAADDPLLALASRLDREADLHRGLAMRQMARAAWMDRLAAIASVVSLFGVVVLASIAAFRALFALGDALSASLLLGVAALLLFLGAFTAYRVTSKIRAAQLLSAREALARADLSEARLHRIAAVLALRQTDSEVYAATLRALEADTRAAG